MNFEDYLNEIQKCIDNKLFIASLTMSLTIPDVCGAIAYPNKNNASRYKKWYRDNIGMFYLKDQQDLSAEEKIAWPSADVIYSLRNNILHEATPTLNKSSIRQQENKVDRFRVDFSESCILSSSDTNTNFDSTITRSFSINAKYLSMILLNCGKTFYTNHKEEIDANYQVITNNFGGEYLCTN